MESSALFQFGLIVRLAAWIFLAVRIVRHEWYREYSLASLYIIFAAVTYLTRIVAAHLLGTSYPYGHIYFWASIPAHALALAALLQAYLRPRRLQFRDLHLALALPAAIAVEALAPWDSHIIFRALNVIYLYQTYLGIVTIARLFTHGVTIGRSTAAVVAALIVPAAFRSMINVLYLHDPQIWTYTFTNIGLELSDVASWIILAYGLRKPDDPAVETGQPMDPVESRTRMIALIRELRRRA